jgi:Cu+-exporting ATPase
VDTGLDKALRDSPEHALSRLAFGIPTARLGVTRTPASRQVGCFHCGEPCPDATFAKDNKTFCCQGCLVVHDLLVESGLEQFYDLSLHPGVRIRKSRGNGEWAYLDDPAVKEQLLDFTDGKTSRVTFHIPTIHCVACLWLLENLFRLHPGVGQGQVNFARRETTLWFRPDHISLSELAALLASIGYKPELTLGELEKRPKDRAPNRQWLQMGIAGFAFGNIMLFSLPAYLGLDSLSGSMFRAVFGYLSLLLAIPVVVYCASDYWRSALLSLRQRLLTLDVPIALGLAALYAQSAYEIVSDHGVGYLDSLAGLVFFLLCGRAFQQKTHDRLAFDRDYKSFFPLAITRKTSDGEKTIPLSSLRVGDRLLVRNGELIPADSRLVSRPTLIDYSFVTGESEPVTRDVGDYLYAGGQHIGAAVEIETVKPVSQSYLTSLWRDKAFEKKTDNLNTLTNRYSRRFTLLVVLVAASAALFWTCTGELARGIKAFTSVLIVACPCALALAAPFALGTAQRLLARLQVFLRNPFVLESMARVDAIVFDKTGTLTAAEGGRVTFRGHDHGRKTETRIPDAEGQAAERIEDFGLRPSIENDGKLSCSEASWVCSLTAQSIHPHAVKIREWLRSTQDQKHQINGAITNPLSHPMGSGRDEGSIESSDDNSSVTPQAADAVHSFVEKPGFGISGSVEGHSLGLGSRAWLQDSGVLVPEVNLPQGSASYLAIDGGFRGAFCFSKAPPPETDRLIKKLGQNYELMLLSGDNERERERYQQLFGPGASLLFNQTPYDKLEFVRRLQASGKTVMMVGDGLNDAGALKQSDVGVAVVERVGVFSPASDVILEAGQVPRLFEILGLASRAVRVVRWSFGISAAYNLVGIAIAAAGILSPLICAVLMPLSSFSVVLFACGMANWAARTVGLRKP